MIESQIALMVLGAAGFGTPLSWRKDEKPEVGHKLTFTQTLQTHSDSMIAPASLLRVLAKISKRAERAYLSGNELKVRIQSLYL
jgi:hypothetical protein